MVAGLKQRITAIVCALVLGAGIALGGVSTAIATTNKQITGAEITWGVRDSFIRYLKSPIAHGSITPAGVVANEAGNAWTWTSATTGTWDQNNLPELQTTGSIYFEGHDKKLEITFSNLSVRFTADGGVLSADARGRKFVSITEQGPMTEYGRVDLVNLTGKSVVVDENANRATISFTGATATEKAKEVFVMLPDNNMAIPSIVVNLANETVPPAPQPEPQPQPQPQPQPDPQPQPATPELCSAAAPADLNTLEGYFSWIFKESMHTKFPAMGLKLVGCEGGWTHNFAWNYQLEAGQVLDPAQPTGTLQFKGVSRLYGHGGAVDVTITNPTITFNADGTATMGVTASGTLEGISRTEKQPATVIKDYVKLSGITYTVENGKVTLAAREVTALAGAGKVWGNHYPVGTQLAPFTAIVPAAPTSNPQPVDSDTSAPVVVKQLSVSKSEVKLGETITFTATGFQPGEEVVFEVHSEVVRLAPVLADPTGVARVNWTVPATFSLGAHTVKIPAAGLEKAIKVVAAPAPAPVAPKCEPRESYRVATAGALTWGLRDSFTTYVRGGIAKGSMTPSGGASWNGSDFVFPVIGGNYDTVTKTGRIYYGGTVAFTGHEGVLNTVISNPSLHINGNSAALYLTVRSNDTSGKQVINSTVHFANVSLTGVTASAGSLQFGSAAVTLTAAGAQAFAGFYSAGEPLDLLSGNTALKAGQICNEKGELVTLDAFGNVTVGDAGKAIANGELAHTGSSAETVSVVALSAVLAGLIAVRSRKRHAQVR